MHGALQSKLEFAPPNQVLNRFGLGWKHDRNLIVFYIEFIGTMLTDSNVCSTIDRVLFRQDRHARPHNDSVLLGAYCRACNLLAYTFIKQPSPSLHSADTLLHRIIILHGECVGSAETHSH